MKRWHRTALCVALSFMCLFICVGYAAVTGELSIQGTVDVQAPKAVYITDITIGNGTDGCEATVHMFSGTIADLSVILGVSPGSEQTVIVTVYNNTIDYYAFRAVNYVLGDETYDNPNIIFDDPDDDDDIGAVVAYENGHTTLHPGTSATVTLTFRYKEATNIPGTLHAILDIHFGLSGEEDSGTDYEGIAGVFLSGSGYGLNDTTQGGKGEKIFNQLKANTFIYAGENLKGGQLDNLEEALRNAHSEHLVFVLQYISDTEVRLYTYEDKYTDSEYVGTSVRTYRAIMTRDSIDADWKSGPLTHGSAEISSISPPSDDSSEIYAIDVNTWQEIVRSP